MNLPLPDDATITLTVGQLRALVEGRTEETPAVANDEEALLQMWAEKATQHLCTAPCPAPGDTASGEKA